MLGVPVHECPIVRLRQVPRERVHARIAVAHQYERGAGARDLALETLRIRQHVLLVLAQELRAQVIARIHVMEDARRRHPQQPRAVVERVEQLRAVRRMRGQKARRGERGITPLEHRRVRCSK